MCLFTTVTDLLFRPSQSWTQTQNLIPPKTSCPQPHCPLCLHVKWGPNLHRGTNGLHQTCPGCFKCFSALPAGLFGFVVCCDFSSSCLILAAEICSTYTPKKNNANQEICSYLPKILKSLNNALISLF